MSLPDRRMPKLGRGVLERHYVSMVMGQSPVEVVWGNPDMPQKRSVGRPRSERVSKALNLLKAGLPWREIYPRALGSRWTALKPYERTLVKRNLRRAVRAVLDRSQHKTKAD